MTAREAAIAAAVRKHLFTLYPGEVVCDCDWVGKDPVDNVLLNQWCAHLAAVIAALDTTTVTETGTYPCCSECGPGCSGRHESRCHCQTMELIAIADEGAARARGEGL